MTKMKNISPAAVLALLLAASQTALAQGVSNNSQVRRGYASDYFEGFGVVDNDTRIPMKEESFWFSVSADTPKAQLEYARGREQAGELNSARKAYEALVRKWPTSPEAVDAQFALGLVQEKRGRYNDAFDQYQYLLVHYAGNCPYYKVLDRQYRVANYLLHNNTSIFGWGLSGLSSIREKFEQIVRNAPRSPIAPEVMLTIGGIREADGEPVEATQVYDGILNRFPASPQAERAAYLAAKCRHALALEHDDNEARCREAISFYKALLERRPSHPQKAELLAWQKDLQNLLVEQNYKKALFYDSRQRSLQASKTAYKRFLDEFGASKYGPVVRERLKALDSGAAPLK